jgi:branched-chain amino acid transport system permease protein
MNSYGISFYWCLPAAFIVTALAGVVLERLLYRRLYSASHLDQVLFSIGLVFMAIAAIDYFMGGQQQLINLPPELSGRFDFLGIDIGRYRLFIIVICAVLTVALQLALTRTRFGSQLRAAVDDGRVARGMGINVSVIFALTFALGSGLAGLGGALGTELLGLDPNFPLKYLIYFMIVVTVGGTSSITGPFIAALLLGIADVAGKYYVPQLGAFIIYAVMILVLILRPHGLFSRESGR